MLNKPTKIEVYIIIAVLFLSVMTIGGFWVVNNVNFSTLTSTFTVSFLSTEDNGELANTEDASDLNESDFNEDTSVTGAEANKEDTNSEESLAYIPTNTGLAKLLEPVELNALILGDSVAQSIGASNPEETSWHASVANDLQVTYPGTIKWDFITGVEYTVNDILRQVPIFSTESDVFIICTGRSDSSTLELDEFRRNYRGLITELETSAPDSDIYLVVEPPVKDVDVNNQYFPYRQVILDLGEEHELPVIDGWQIFVNDPKPLDSLLADGVHPNDAGYRLIADALVERMEESLAEEEN